MQTVLIIFGLLAASAAFAQTPATLAPQAPPALQQAFGQKLLEEINANLQLRAQIIEKDAEIEKLKQPNKDKK